jgi:hypothetical protein
MIASRIPGHDGDFTRAAYRDDLCALVGLLLSRGLSPGEIGDELRNTPVPTRDGPALDLVDHLKKLRDSFVNGGSKRAAS